MKFLLVLLLSTVMYNTEALAQKHKDSLVHYNNSICFELGGPALIYSMGYERTWFRTPNFSAISSAGFSYIPDGITMIYIEPGILRHFKNVALELGLAINRYEEQTQNGSSFATPSGIAEVFYLTARAGVRFFSKNQHLHYRLGITPLIELHNNENPNGLPKENKFHFWANVFTVGYRF